ncbi:MAG: hypothetical protein AB1742_05585, partial [bacterium]
VKLMDFADEKKRLEWMEKKNMKVFSLFHKTVPAQEVDILLAAPVEFKQAARNRVVRRAGGLTIPVAGIADLIKMKEVVGRKHDVSDINMLRRVQALSRRRG